MLRLIAGLEAIDIGRLVLDGDDITQRPSSKRDLAMVFQSYALYPHMTVAENMSFALRLAKVEPSEIAKKVEHAAKILNLTPYLHRKVIRISRRIRRSMRRSRGFATARRMLC